MKIIRLTCVASIACVLWFAVIAYFQEAPPPPPMPPTPQPVVQAFYPASPAPLPLKVLPLPIRQQLPSERCEISTVSGKHTARAEWEARQGALEDAADICPAGKVTPAHVICTPVQGEQGVMGYPAIQCIQKAVCTLCGEKLARKYELN